MAMPSSDSKSISFANSDWILDVVREHETDLVRSIMRRKQPRIRLAYIARQRNAKEPPWNWCKTCCVELPVLQVHRSTVACPSCGQRFLVIHEGSEANEKLREDPNYSGPFHDILSAAWHEWSVKPVGREHLPAGSLAFDVVPFELPTRAMSDGIRHLTRRERRKMARRGRGRRRSIRVERIQKLWVNEPYEPEVVRERVGPSEPELVSDAPMEISFGARMACYQRSSLGSFVKVCRRCDCRVEIRLVLYIERVSLVLNKILGNDLQQAGLLLAKMAIAKGLCFCGRLIP